MVLNPQEIADKKIVTGTIRIEPNAIDFTADNVKQIDSSMFCYSNNKKDVSHRKLIDIRTYTTKEVQQSYGLPVEVASMEDKEGWILSPGKSYDVTSNVYVEVPEGMAAVIIGRSTGNRNGLIVTSGLYDSGCITSNKG